jgi:hypothetical protein
MTGTRLNDCTPAPAEQAKYSPSTDVMELARSLLDFTGYPPPNQTKKEWVEECVARVARAFTAYGDRRAHDARQQILVDSTPLREAIAREARAAAIEEAAQAASPIADEELPEPYWDNARARRMDWACAVGRCVSRIRTLATAPPQSQE